MALNLYENSAFFLTIFYSAKDVNQPVPWLYVKGPRDIGGVQQNPDEEKGSLGRPSKFDRFHKTWRMRRAVQTALRPSGKIPLVREICADLPVKNPEIHGVDLD